MFRLLIPIFAFALINSCVGTSPSSSFETPDNASEISTLKPLSISADDKLTLFRFGVIGPASVDELEKLTTGFCVLENYRLKALKLDGRWVFSGKQIGFPNARIRRFDIFESKLYSFSCDGTYDEQEKGPKELVKEHAGLFFEISD